MDDDVMGGVIEIAFRDFTIPSYLLGEPEVNIEEGTRERNTQAGTFSRGSGTLDTVEVTVPLYLPSWGWLGENILRSRYNAPTAPQTEGNVVWNASTCTGEYDAGPLNIHYVCEDLDNQDLHLFNARLKVNLNPTFATGEDLMVELVFSGNPDENGDVFRLGTGDLDALSYWDAETESTEPYTS